MKKQIENDIYLAIKEYDVTKKMIEVTNNKNYGDFSTNIAMKLARQLNSNPMEIAQKIINKISNNLYKNIEIIKPGFINFFLKDEIFIDNIKKVLDMNSKFGSSNQNKYINIEFVSANPTGHLHLGHARGAAVGSSLIKILEFAGNKVDAEYYINDAGNQIDILGQSIFIRYQNIFGSNIQMPEDSYRGEDINDCAKFLFKKYGDQYYQQKYEKVKDLFISEGKEYMLNKIKEHLNSYETHMNIYASELSLYNDGSIKKTLEKIKASTYEKNGALWLKTMDKGDDKDRVLRKSDGTYTYLTPDISYHDQKISRGYDELINIWGADHIGYIQRMKIAIEYLGFDSNKLDILTVQMVKLFKDGKEVKMSKRKGTAYTLEELFLEIGVDAARWFMLEKSANSQFVFDINKVTQNNDNPLYTVQYTHARINQILEKSKIIPDPKKYNKQEKIIINEIYKFPNLIEKISKNHKVHLLCQYLIDLVKLFNSYYTNTKIIGHENESSMIALSLAVKIIIKNGLNLLIINAPNKM